MKTSLASKRRTDEEICFDVLAFFAKNPGARRSAATIACSITASKAPWFYRELRGKGLLEGKDKQGAQWSLTPKGLAELNCLQEKRP